MASSAAMPEQDQDMSWFDKVKFFISMWVVVFVVFNVWDIFRRHYGRWSLLSTFTIPNAIITAVIALVITIFIVTHDTSEL